MYSVDIFILFACVELIFFYQVNYAGGVLGEIPLQWALRKKYYEMMVLLIESGSDMSHKSRQNNDSLHIACKLGNFSVHRFSWQIV